MGRWFSGLCGLKGQGQNWRISTLYTLLPTSEEFLFLPSWPVFRQGFQAWLACRKAESAQVHQRQLVPRGLLETSLFGTQSMCPVHTRCALNRPEVPTEYRVQPPPTFGVLRPTSSAGLPPRCCEPPLGFFSFSGPQGGGLASTPQGSLSPCTSGVPV